MAQIFTDFRGMAEAAATRDEGAASVEETGLVSGGGPCGDSFFWDYVKRGDTGADARPC